MAPATKAKPKAKPRTVPKELPAPVLEAIDAVLDGVPVDEAAAVDEAAERDERVKARARALADYDLETLEGVSEITDRLREARDDYEQCRGIAASKKKRLEGVGAELFEYKSARADNRGKPVQPKLYPDPAEDLDGGAQLAGVGPDDDAWKAEPVSRLERAGLIPKLCETLAGHGLDTLGKLAAFVEPNAAGYCETYSDLKGIGAKSADKIAEAFALFWEQWAQEGLGNANGPGDGEADSDGGEPD